MRNVVIGFLGTQLDRGKRRNWRPSIQLCTHDGFAVDRLELIHDKRHSDLANQIAADIARLSPEVEVSLIKIDMADPWDFQEVYAKLYDFAKDYGFDEDRERYYIHLTTGTHVAQICWFLLTESRHIPARLIQTGPPRDDKTAHGTLDIIDLDLARYNALQRRFEAAAREHSALLLGGVKTKSPKMLALAAELDLIISHSDAPITLVGEAGTGKSTLAVRLHELKLIRRRVKGRLVSVNCATLRGEAALSALLGQRRAAGPERAGLLREADGGVLYLDRIEELSPDLQSALVQAIETGRYCPVGSDTEVTCRMHVIATTIQDPAAAVAKGAMRPELAALLSQWVLHLPPLRARRCDLGAYLRHLVESSERDLDRKTGFNTDAQGAYLRFAADPTALWLGNLRDLRTSVHRMATLAERGRITLAMVQAEIARLQAQWAAARTDPDAALLADILPDAAALDEFDRAQLAAVLRACRESTSLSAAGRRLFAASRQSKASQNDADRLRKYLARFGLDWAKIQAGL